MSINTDYIDYREKSKRIAFSKLGSRIMTMSVDILRTVDIPGSEFICLSRLVVDSRKYNIFIFYTIVNNKKISRMDIIFKKLHFLVNKKLKILRLKHSPKIYFIYDHELELAYQENIKEVKE